MANELKDLIAYLADKINYEVGEDDSVSMKRPGGGGQEGIFYYSPNLKPWILAQRALKLLNTPDHSEAIAARCPVAIGNGGVCNRCYEKKGGWCSRATGLNCCRCGEQQTKVVLCHECAKAETIDELERVKAGIVGDTTALGVIAAINRELAALRGGEGK